MINATKARNVYLKKARKTVAKTIRQCVKNGNASAIISFSDISFRIAPIITQWLESMGYSVELQKDDLAILVTWV